MAASYASAAQKGGAVCFLSPPVMGNEALFALVPTAGVERLESDGLSGIWFGARWRAADARRRTRGAHGLGSVILLARDVPGAPAARCGSVAPLSTAQPFAIVVPGSV